ncbi:MAG: NTP transferase domain-containing protein [Proteobacteria bacterium]|nr:NTP transferase domain-containing protein [Pseudomonadota bacterium]
MKDVVAVILAAGRGKRMHSMQSKVLHKVADRPILDWMLDACQLAGIENIVVVIGPQSNDIRAHLARDGHALNIEIAVQEEPRGTGDAVRSAIPKLQELKPRYAVILLGDLPNLQASTLKKIMLKRAQKLVYCLTMVRDEPAAYGRIVRNNDGTVARIVEFKDCTPEEIAIREVNAGIYSMPMAFLETAIPQIDNNNAAGEYYFTDIVEIANRENIPVQPVIAEDPGELMGVNTPDELTAAQAWRKKLSL